MKKLTFFPQNHSIEFEDKPTILELAETHHIPLNHSCGGMGSCTTCLVIIKKLKNPTNPRNEIEQEHAITRDFSDFERLACQTEATDEMEILIPVDTIQHE